MQADEQNRGGQIYHIGARPLSELREEDAYWLSVTDAMAATTVDVGSVDRCSLRFIPEEYDDQKGSGLGLVPAFVEVDEDAETGHEGSLWRTVRTEQLENSTRSRVQIPGEVLETLGYDPDDSNGKLVDVYAGDRLLGFGKPVTQTFSIPRIPDDL